MDLKAEKVPAPLDTGPSLRTSLWCRSLDARTGEIVFDQDLRHQRLRPPVLPAQRDIIMEYWYIPQPGCYFTGVDAKDVHGPCYQAYMARTGADDASSPSSADGDLPPMTRPRGKPCHARRCGKISRRPQGLCGGRAKRGSKLGEINQATQPTGGEQDYEQSSPKAEDHSFKRMLSRQDEGTGPTTGQMPDSGTGPCGSRPAVAHTTSSDPIADI